MATTALEVDHLIRLRANTKVDKKKYFVEGQQPFKHDHSRDTACMTTEGKQCKFPFKYANESGTLDFFECSTLDVYKPWCPTDIDPDGNPTEWGLCMPDCPSQEIEIVCQDPPPPPALADISANPKSVNYTVYGIIPDRDISQVTPGVRQQTSISNFPLSTSNK